MTLDPGPPGLGWGPWTVTLGNLGRPLFAVMNGHPFLRGSTYMTHDMNTLPALHGLLFLYSALSSS